ncbi:MAG: DUF421 domain-containing protein, partial [Candidatus Limnocylindrales bacterium]
MPTLPDIGSGLADVVLRTAIVYLFLVAAIRISGKREVGQMSVLELIVVLLISDAVQNSMVGDNSSIWGGLVAVTTLLTLDFGLKALAGRSKRLRTAIEGEPRLLVRDGRLLEKALREEGLEPDDVRAAVRAHGLERPRRLVHAHRRLGRGRTHGHHRRFLPQGRPHGTGPQARA